MKRDITFYLKWLGTAILIFGTIVNSAGFYPEGPLILAVGGIVWLTVSVIWREYSLIVVNAAMTFAALAGLAWKYFY